MTTVLILLLINAVAGAIDTLYYHEYKAQLPQNLEHTKTELQLHAGRDAVYFVIYGGLALWQPHGLFVIALGALLLVEIVITMTDFVVEDRDRAALGGMAPGERILHTFMAIVYGSMLANLMPILLTNLGEPTGLARHDAPGLLSILAAVTAVGILLSGIRDLAATLDALPERRFARFTG